MKTGPARIPLAVLLVALLLATACGKESQTSSRPALVQVETAARAPALALDRYSATVMPGVQVPVAFDSGGYVETLATTPGANGHLRRLEPGDPVRRGRVLAELRQSDYEDKVSLAAVQVTQAEAASMNSAAKVEAALAGVRGAEDQVRQAEAAVRAADAQRLQAVAGVRAADANLANNEATYERVQALFEQDSATASNRDAAQAQFLASRAQADQAREQVRAAEAVLNEARAQVGMARSQLAQARTQVTQARAGSMSDDAQVEGAAVQLREARRAQGDSQLKSPLDGVVLQRNVEVGALVGAGTVGYVVADLSRVKVVFGVVDKQLELLRPGMEVSVLAPALAGRTFHGRILSLSAAADSETRTFQVEVAVDNPDQALKAGMVVSLAFQGDPSGPEEVLTVPLNAVQGKEGTTYHVFTVEGEGTQARARIHEVRLGEVVGNRVVVLEGIQPGDRVIVGGVEYVTDGGSVQVVAR